MTKTPITFDRLPTAIEELHDKVDRLLALVDDLTRPQSEAPSSRWLTVEELREYLPGKPAISTLYGKVQRREIPFLREGKRLAFRQSDIDLWLQGKSRQTQFGMGVLTEQYLSTAKKGSN